MDASKVKTIAFFGATGGSALAALTLALEKGYTCTALARTPSKLTTLLLTRGISAVTLGEKLTIIEGDARDEAAVRRVLIAPSTGDSPPRHQLVDMIVSGLGGKPTFTPNPLRPGLDDPHICEESSKVILSALRSLVTPTTTPPIVVVISTTGMSEKRDIPLPMVPIYHWMLPVAHADKAKMEAVILDPKNVEDKIIRFGIVVKASLLTDGKRLGTSKVRSGVEGKEPSPPIGYTISRDDVGGWIFEKLIEEAGANAEKYSGQRIVITY